jgi:hypothetical protein
MADEQRLPPPSVLIGTLLGCVLPAIAYAEAMSAFFGFGVVRRKWAWLLLGVPTTVWLAVASRTPIPSRSLGLSLSITAMALAAQLALAAIVSAAVACVVRGRQSPRRP